MRLHLSRSVRSFNPDYRHTTGGSAPLAPCIMYISRPGPRMQMPCS
jgi:hypothetical protein